MAVKYYTDDSISVPTPVPCRAVVQHPAPSDLFSQPEIPAVTVKSEPIPPIKKEAKPVQTVLTLFDQWYPKPSSKNN